MQKIITMLLLSFSFHTAFASVVYTDVNDTQIQIGGNMDIDIDQDGTVEFTLEDMGFGSAAEIGTMFDPAEINFVTWTDNDDWDAYKPVPANAAIDASSGFYAKGDCYFNPGWASAAHQFPVGSDQLIGVQFKKGNDTHYAWICVLLASDGSVTIKDMAYETTANTSIHAGDKGNGGTTSLNTLAQLHVKVYPNPATTYLKIEGLNNTTQTINVYSSDGRLLIRKETQGRKQLTLDLTKLKQGYFVLEVDSDNGLKKHYSFFKS